MRTGPATWFRVGAAVALIGAVTPALQAATSVAIDLADVRAADPDEVITLGDVDLGPGGFVDLELKRFRVTTPATRFVLGRHDGPDEPISFDADDVVLLRGGVRDRPGSRVLLVGSSVAGRGHVDLDGRRYELTLPGAMDAPAPDPARLRARVIRSRSSLPPDVPLCGAIAPPAAVAVDATAALGATAAAPTAAPGATAVATAGVPVATTGVRVIELAIETDYEYYTLHEDAASAAAYVLEL
ncbi:MAG: hypothetical protein GY715_04480, partial [Planctomycetes bacterium]|nr:hypothetical protein [Planctomycetota bacterium]